MMLRPGTFIDLQWYRSTEARDIISCISHRNLQKRKVFGLLEKPSVPLASSLEEYKYKILIYGKTGVGKTSTVAKLSGNDIPSSHCETPGIQVTEIYWPAKVVEYNKVVMFELEIWDAGENSMKKFDHILPALKEKADGILFLFSCTDKSSFQDLPQYMSKIQDSDDNLCKLVLGTKFDLHAQSEITLRDIREFESLYHLPILRIKNIPLYHPSESRSEISEVAPILNMICECLWQRDLMLAGKLTNFQEDGQQMSYV
ncbi:ciliogenesis and planar polarity effector 2-like isoform X2 [Lineus longissimus]